jgi:putative intracellular protease/amidase
MKIGIPVYDDVDMFDVTGPFEMVDWANFDVEVVASEPGMKRFRSRGFPFQVARSFVDAAHLHLRIMRFGCRAGSLPL